jgi:neutral ceramidase
VDKPGPATATLRAGAAQVDVTPEAGVHIAGTVHMYRPAAYVLDPIYAKTLFLETVGPGPDRRAVCIVSLDLVIVTDPYVRAIRAFVAEKFGLDPNAVLVHAVQNHTGPSLGHFMLRDDERSIPAEWSWVRGGDDSYHPLALERIYRCLEEAHARLRPVELGVGSGIEGRVAFNRRMVMRDGTIAMPGGGSRMDPRSRYLEGPIDPELGILCFRESSLRFAAMLLSYTCHPVNVFPKPIISADWPGALANELRATFGAACVPLVLNGPCGNVNPWDPYDPHYVRDHRRMGSVLADTARKIVDELRFDDDVALDWRSEHLQLPLRRAEPAEVEAARQLLEEHPTPTWIDEQHRQVDPNWVYAKALAEHQMLVERGETWDYEIQVLRIGRVALVGLPGEPFVEAGLQIKLASPTFTTYVVHNTNYAAYIPTPQAFQRGGYETKAGLISKLAPEAFDLIVAAAGRLLGETFA